jgi:hypothetical protein
VASLGGGSGVSSGSHQVVNVLGMPPKPAGVVLNQRRMSYDTATGSYMLVTKYEQEQERLAAAAQQQQQHDEAVLATLVPFVQPQEQQQQLQQAATPAGSPSMQQHLQPQQQQQQHHTGAEQQVSLHLQLPEVTEIQPMHGSEVQPMHGSSIGSGSSPGPSPSPAAHQMQAHVQRLVAALAKKGYSTSLLDGSSGDHQQQQGAGVESFSSGTGNTAAASSLQQSQGGVQSAARQSSSWAAAPQLPRPRYTAKVCDFGFSQCLRAGQSHCSTAAAGTITHQAPEVLRSGHLSPAADIYAFGIIRE